MCNSHSVLLRYKTWVIPMDQDVDGQMDTNLVHHEAIRREREIRTELMGVLHYNMRIYEEELDATLQAWKSEMEAKIKQLKEDCDKRVNAFLATMDGAIADFGFEQCQALRDLIRNQPGPDILIPELVKTTPDQDAGNDKTTSHDHGTPDVDDTAIEASESCGTTRIWNIERKIPSTSQSRTVIRRSQPRPRFQKGDNKLTNDNEFSLWIARIRHELLAWDCLFLIDNKVEPTEEYDEKDRTLMSSAVTSYLLSNLEERHQRLVRNAKTPADILTQLERLCEPISNYSEHHYRDLLYKLRFDPTKQTVLTFLTEFENLVEKISKCPDSVLTDHQVKYHLLLSVSEACPAIKDVELRTPQPGHTVQQLKDMLLLEEQRLSALNKRAQATEPEKAMYFKGRGGKTQRRVFKMRDSHVKSTSGNRLQEQCKTCGNHGHTAETCFRRGRKCFNCGSFDGHLSRDCPSKETFYTRRNRQAKSNASQKRDTPKKAKSSKGTRMPLKEAMKLSKLRTKAGHARLAMTLDPTQENTTEDERMCWVQDMESDDASDGAALYAARRVHDSDSDDDAENQSSSNDVAYR
ncbi:unnamed protein product, partial [Nesidiocoris tenuis]